jgi:LEA14-like dessication related protein
MSWEKTRNYFFILIPILLLILSSCATLYNRLESPTIQIIDIEVKELKPLEAVFNVQLRVLNPNDISIIAKGIKCDLEINNNYLAMGVSNASIEIPAFGTAILPIEVFSSALDVIRNIIALSDKEILKYRIKGRLKIEGGSFMPSYVPFESEEHLNIKGLMKTR